MYNNVATIKSITNQQTLGIKYLNPVHVSGNLMPESVHACMMRECFTRDLWGIRLFEFLRVATFILVFESIQAFESSRSKTYHSYMNN